MKKVSFIETDTTYMLYDPTIEKAENKFFPTLYAEEKTKEEIKTQLQEMLKIGFNEIIVSLHFKYNESKTLVIVENLNEIKELISLLKIKVHCLKFHMTQTEFDKKTNSVNDYINLVKQTAPKIETEIITIFNEVLTPLETYWDTISDFITELKKSYKVAITFLNFHFTSRNVDKYITACDYVCVNWYPSILWNKYPDIPAEIQFIEAVNTQGLWIEKALTYGKKVIISEFGITPYYEALQNPSTTGRVTSPHYNELVIIWYISALIKSNVILTVGEVWTWYNEFLNDSISQKYSSIINIQKRGVNNVL